MSLLFCFAHPDDESFAAAGTAMKYAARGVRIVLVTATLGDKGRVGDPPICAPDELAEYRERELREASAIIGFDELHLLRYRDRELADAPPEAVRSALVPIIRRTRPSVVFTFDPNGFNLHPDHVAISRFTSDAIAAAADPRWYPDAGDPHSVSRLLWIPTLTPWDAAVLDRLDEHRGVDFIIDVSAWRDCRPQCSPDAASVGRAVHLGAARSEPSSRQGDLAAGLGPRPDTTAGNRRHRRLMRRRAVRYVIARMMRAAGGTRIRRRDTHAD
jgi:LmbE family N-acetylglucosaminyl deacetylase